MELKEPPRTLQCRGHRPGHWPGRTPPAAELSLCTATTEPTLSLRAAAPEGQVPRAWALRRKRPRNEKPSTATEGSATRRNQSPCEATEDPAQPKIKLVN